MRIIFSISLVFTSIPYRFNFFYSLTKFFLTPSHIADAVFIMGIRLTTGQKLIRDTTRKFCEEELEPIAAECDEMGEFPEDVVKKMGKLGLLGLTIPKEYGGSGADAISYLLVLEEIAKICTSTALTIEAHSSLGVSHIFEVGTKEQREKYVPALAKGEKLAAWGLTEANAGSDAGATQTTASLDGDEWILNGTKIFITNGHVADIFTIMARTSKGRGPKGVSAFIIEKGTDGFSIGTKEDKLGMRASVTSELVFENCRIPKENLLGKEGKGFIGAMRILDAGRVAISAISLGIGQRALDESIKYAKEREQFGRPIAKFQAIQWMLSDMATELDAARLLVYRAAKLMEEGKKFTKEAAMAKLFAAEMGSRIADKAIQIHGGYGYTTDYPVEKLFRDAKLCEIGEGTNEVQRLVIARELLK